MVIFAQEDIRAAGAGYLHGTLSSQGLGFSVGEFGENLAE